MTHRLAAILCEPTDQLASQLEQLEKLSGYPAIDARLIADIESGVRTKTKQLKLDPADTTGRELYHQLRLRLAVQAEAWFKARLAKRPAELTSSGQVIEAELAKLKVPRSVWALKPAAIKTLLRALPPKQVMKKLHYRSVASLLKYQNPGQLYVAARLHESAVWQSRLLKKIGQLKSSDFASRPIEVIELNAKLASPSSAAIPGWAELGALVIQPNDQLLATPASFLAALALSSKLIEDSRAQMSYLKLSQVSPGFGHRLIDLTAGQPAVLVVGSLNLPWRSLQSFFGRAAIKQLPGSFEPHLLPADLHYQSLERLLAKSQPAFGWWQATAYLAAFQTARPVSLNLADLAIDNANQAVFTARSLYYLRQATADELIRRYLEQPAFARLVVEALEQQLIGVVPAGMILEEAGELPAGPVRGHWEGAL